MSYTSTKILFMTTLISGLLITISSNSWLSAWMGLEINLLSFIPLMSNNDNMLMTEAALKYFLIQALASSSLLFVVISKSMVESMFTILNLPLSSVMISTPLLMKSGAAPLHWWFPSVMEGLSWMNCIILMTMQKIAPLVLISYTINSNSFLTTIIVISVTVGSIGGLNQTSIRKILTYSSINHMGWMLMAMIMGENMWLLYFMIYSLLTITIITIISPLNISFVNQTFLIKENNKVMKFLLFSSLLSLGGLPPFLGFMPKWMIIQFMIINSSPTIVTIMIILSLITLYYYLRISYSAFIILSTEPCWIQKNNDNMNALKLSFILMTISILGLNAFTAFINLY
uniref:NADH dehydrogenase subunit 2 n=1 Tax=Pseudophoraspis kabakovi TaxID=2421534 RepID=UPI0027995845|nr:NADH dehydrogenase subunit 2 [Pseudophoraspis kabakovi]WGO57509.1 NADH dehydrogenase subunit 2 [Pseudophoraspis kabakovi]